MPPNTPSKYLSCISTADRKYIDQAYLSPPSTAKRLSFHRFAQEEPTKQDWKAWDKFWRTYCNRFLELPKTLGEWTSPSHRVWPWLLDIERDVVYHQNYHSLTAYIPLMKLTTRAGSQYIYLSEVNIIPTNVLPITINKVTDNIVSVKGVGSSLLTLNVCLNTFWEMLMCRGGTWMWDYVSNRSNDTGWLMTALQQGSAVLATDRSYSRIRGPTVCGAGWVFACHRSRRIRAAHSMNFPQMQVPTAGNC